MVFCSSLCDACIRGLRSELKNCHVFSALLAVHFFSKSTISDMMWKGNWGLISTLRTMSLRRRPVVSLKTVMVVVPISVHTK